MRGSLRVMALLVLGAASAAKACPWMGDGAAADDAPWVVGTTSVDSAPLTDQSITRHQHSGDAIVDLEISLEPDVLAVDLHGLTATPDQALPQACSVTSQPPLGVFAGGDLPRAHWPGPAAGVLLLTGLVAGWWRRQDRSRSCAPAR